MQSRELYLEDLKGLILNKATASLDPRSEKNIFPTVEHSPKGRTIISIGHHISLRGDDDPNKGPMLILFRCGISAPTR